MSTDLKNDIRKMVRDLIPELQKSTIDIMLRKGIKKQSNLIRSVEYKTQNKGISMLANDYLFYTSEGRRPFVKKVPVTDLIDWIKRYNIRPNKNMSINQLAFAIQNSIYKNGIVGKNFFNKIIDTTSDITEETIADDLSEAIADEVVFKLKK